jgi:hypothetical protein
MLTMAVEEELNVVYFDGSSAANSYLGHLDSQDIVIWGTVRRDKLMAEWERIKKLCDWGAQYNIDAFVRYVFILIPLSVKTESSAVWNQACRLFSALLVGF